MRNLEGYLGISYFRFVFLFYGLSKYRTASMKVKEIKTKFIKNLKNTKLYSEFLRIEMTSDLLN